MSITIQREVTNLSINGLIRMMYDDIPDQIKIDIIRKSIAEDSPPDEICLEACESVNKTMKDKLIFIDKVAKQGWRKSHEEGKKCFEITFGMLNEITEDMKTLEDFERLKRYINRMHTACENNECLADIQLEPPDTPPEYKE